MRLLLEFLVAGVGCLDHRLRASGTDLYMPFVQRAGDRPRLVLHRRSPPSSIVAFGNAVNLTDGLDGLATMPVIIAASPSRSSPIWSATRVFADYLGIPACARRRRPDRPAARRSSARGSPSCGSTRRRRRCSWATPAASRWAARSARSRSRPSTRSCSVIIGGLFVVEAVSVIIQVVLLQAHRQARLPDGADPPPFRAARLVRADRGDPLLDHRLRAGAGRPLDAEAAMITGPRLRRKALCRARPCPLGAGDGRGAAGERRRGDGLGSSEEARAKLGRRAKARRRCDA